MADGFWESVFVAAAGVAPDFFTRIVERAGAAEAFLPAGFLPGGSGEVIAAGFGARCFGVEAGIVLAGIARDADVFGAADLAATLGAAALLAGLPLLLDGFAAADELRVALPIIRLQPALQ